MISNRSSLYSLIVLSTLLFTISAGCSKKKQIRGSDIVPNDVMVEMMVDIHLIDGITNDVTYYRKFNPNDSIDLYGSVYDRYDVTKEDFHRTLQEYASIPRLLDKLYADVMKELNLMQEELDRERELDLEKKKKESGKALPPKDEQKSRIRGAEIK